MEIYDEIIPNYSLSQLEKIEKRPQGQKEAELNKAPNKKRRLENREENQCDLKKKKNQIRLFESLSQYESEFKKNSNNKRFIESEPQLVHKKNVVSNGCESV